MSALRRLCATIRCSTLIIMPSPADQNLVPMAPGTPPGASAVPAVQIQTGIDPVAELKKVNGEINAAIPHGKLAYIIVGDERIEIRAPMNKAADSRVGQLLRSIPCFDLEIEPSASGKISFQKVVSIDLRAPFFQDQVLVIRFRPGEKEFSPVELEVYQKDSAAQPPARGTLRASYTYSVSGERTLVRSELSWEQLSAAISKEVSGDEKIILILGEERFSFPNERMPKLWSAIVRTKLRELTEFGIETKYEEGCTVCWCQLGLHYNNNLPIIGEPIRLSAKRGLSKSPELVEMSRQRGDKSWYSIGETPIATLVGWSNNLAPSGAVGRYCVKVRAEGVDYEIFLKANKNTNSGVHVLLGNRLKQCDGKEDRKSCVGSESFLRKRIGLK